MSCKCVEDEPRCEFCEKLAFDAWFVDVEDEARVQHALDEQAVLDWEWELMTRDREEEEHGREDVSDSLSRNDVGSSVPKGRQ